MSSSNDGGAPKESSGGMNGCIRHGDGGVSSEEPSGPRPWGQQVVAKLTRAGKQCFRAIVSTVLRRGPIPKHVAFIMDGNRRFTPLSDYNALFPCLPSAWLTQVLVCRCVQVGGEETPGQERRPLLRLHTAQGVPQVVS